MIDTPNFGTKYWFGMMRHPCRDLFVSACMQAGIFLTLIDAHRSIIGPESVLYALLAGLTAYIATLVTMGSIIDDMACRPN